MRRDAWFRETVGGDTQNVVCNILHAVFLAQEEVRSPEVRSW